MKEEIKKELLNLVEDTTTLLDLICFLEDGEALESHNCVDWEIEDVDDAHFDLCQIELSHGNIIGDSISDALQELTDD